MLIPTLAGRVRPRSLVLPCLAVLVAQALVAPAGAAAGTAQQAPLLPAPAGAEVVPGSWIVTTDGAGDVAEVAAEARTNGAEVTAQYEAALDGLAVTASAEEVDRIRGLDGVAAVSPDIVVRGATTQTGAPWSLDRIDQRPRSLDGAYSYDGTGASVVAYVVDSGIRSTHTQLSGRVLGGADFVGDGNGWGDCYGHGTGVAGALGGTTYGVAKAVQFVSVRVLDCTNSGTASTAIAGLDWIVQNGSVPGVVNLSLVTSGYNPLDQAVLRAVNAGFVVVVAAGNNGALSCSYSPARAASAITVSATSVSDARATWSNYGSCTDLFAPGDVITTAWGTGSGGDNQAVTTSGTSFAAPYVAGAAALALEDNPTWTPAQVTTFLRNQATTGVVSNAGTGSPNALLYSAPALSVSPIVVAGDPLVNHLLVTLDVQIGDMSYVPTTGSTTVTTRDAATYPGCANLQRPRTSAESVAALISAAEGVPSTLTGASYGSPAEQCISAAVTTSP